MKIFKKRIKPDWIFPKAADKTGQKIWRLLSGEGILVVELRDTDKKSIEFVGIDLTSGSLLWKNNHLPEVSEEERWWTTLNLVYRNVVLLQQFPRPDMPTSGKIFTIDLQTGKPLWQNQEVSFLNADGDTIFCLKRSFTSETVAGIDFRTGQEREVSASDLPVENYVHESGVALPELIDSPSDIFQGQIILDEAMRKKIPSDSNQLTMLKIGERSVIGFYAMSGKDQKGSVLYDARLIVADKERKIVFEDIVDRNVYVPLEDFYFAVDRRLIYVRNSEEIVAVKLG